VTAVLALARAESWRLLRHPVTLTAILLTVAPWNYEWLSGELAVRYPVLHDEDRHVQLPLLLLAAGTLLAVNLAALRVRRDGMAAFYSVQAMTAAHRTVAHLLSATVLAAVAGVLVVLRLAWLTTAPGAIGRVSAAEVLTAPAVVLLAGAIGVLLARAAPVPVAAPLAIVAFAMFTLFSAVGPQWSRRLGPIMLEDEALGSLPPDLSDRPAGAHLAYLAALTVLLGVIAAGLNGLNRTVVVAVAAAATVAVAATGVLQTNGRTLTPGTVAGHVCGDAEGVTYCAFPEYTQRAAQWSEAGQGVTRWVPPEAAGTRYAVRQRIFIDSPGDLTDPVPGAAWRAEDAAAGLPEAVPVGTSWGGRDGYSRQRMLQFSIAFANRVVTGSAAGIYDNAPVCGARGLLILWLGAQATSGTHQAYLESLENSYGGNLVSPVLDSASGPSFPRETAELTRDLLNQPAAEVGARIRQNWVTLADPATALTDGAGLFGLRVPAGSGEPLC
jgi:hypothetical protein